MKFNDLGCNVAQILFSRLGLEAGYKKITLYPGSIDRAFFTLHLPLNI
jgi:hypothetical protein